MSKAPIVRQVAWSAALPQLVIPVLIITILLISTDLRTSQAIFLGTFIYLVYSIVIRAIVAREHQAGIRKVKVGKFDEAIPHFEESYAFFTRNEWLDRLRYLLLGSSSKASYREMALVNIAFCYAQIGEGKTSREYYERALREFPESVLAQSALNMVYSFEATEGKD